MRSARLFLLVLVASGAAVPAQLLAVPTVIAFESAPVDGFEDVCTFGGNVELRNAGGAPDGSHAGVDVTIARPASVSLFSDDACANGLPNGNTLTFGSGTSSRTFHYLPTTAGTYSFDLTSSPDLGTATIPFTVSEWEASQLALVNLPTALELGLCRGPFAVESRNDRGDSTAVPRAVSFELTADAALVSLWSDPGCISAASSLVFGSGTSLTGGFYLRADAAGVTTVRATALGDGGRLAADAVVVTVLDPAMSVGSWTSAERMPSARRSHSATLLLDGRVLVFGGLDGTSTESNEALLFDPLYGSWVTSPARPAVPRSLHTATLVGDGRVLVVGGDPSQTPQGTRIFYDPTTDSWSNSTNDAGVSPRRNHTATRLPSGKVVFIGGAAAAGFVSAVDYFDPAVGGLLALPSDLPNLREFHSASVRMGLPGHVMVIGGALGSAAVGIPDVYEESSAQMATFGGPREMPEPRSESGAVQLENGHLLVAGGLLADRSPSTAVDVWIGDTPLGWNTEGDPADLPLALAGVSAALLPDGRVLVAGGLGPSGDSSAAFAYDRPADAWLPAGNLSVARSRPTTTVLPGGRAVVIGGRIGEFASSDAVDVFLPEPQEWSSEPFGPQRRGHLAALQADGSLLVVGGRTTSGTGSSVATAHLRNGLGWSDVAAAPGDVAYATATALHDRVVVVGELDASERPVPGVLLWDGSAWTRGASDGPATVHHTATLLSDGRILVLHGCSDIGCSDPPVADAAAVYDPASDRWTRTPGLTLEGRAFHTATLLTSGHVLVTGGASDGGAALDRVETLTVSPDGTITAEPNDGLPTELRGHTATLLPDGSVLVAGGLDGVGDPSADASLFVPGPSPPAGGTWVALPPMPVARAGHTATLLSDGRVVLVGGDEIPVAWDLLTRSWIQLPASAASLSEHTATLLPSGELLVLGGSDALTGSLATDHWALPTIDALGQMRPVLAAGPHAAAPGSPMTLSGSGLAPTFTGVHTGRTGAPSNHPLLRLRHQDSGRLIALSATSWTDTSVGLRLPDELPAGIWWLTAHVNGVGSDAVSLTVDGSGSSPARSLEFAAAPDTLAAGACSGLIRVELLEAGSPAVATEEMTVTLSTASFATEWYGTVAHCAAGQPSITTALALASGAASGEFVLRHPQEGALTLTATAPGWIGASHSLTVTAVVEAPPDIDETASGSATVGVPYEYDDDRTASAVSSTTVLWSADAAPTGFAIETSGLVTWTPASPGTERITLRASNASGDSTYTFDVLVADGGADGGVEVDGGTDGPRSYYSCGCNGSSGSPLTAVLAVLALAALGVRQRRLGLLLACLLMPVAALGVDPPAGGSGDAAAELPSLAFLGIQSSAGVDPVAAEGLSDFLQTELASLRVYRVIGSRDIQTLLGLEAQKQMLGCEEDASCIAEIAGALGVQRAMAGTLARFGQSALLNLTILDVGNAKVIARAGQRIRIEEDLEPLLDVLRPLLLQLIAEDPAARPRLGDVAGVSSARDATASGTGGEPAPSSAGGTGGRGADEAPRLTLALRGDADLLAGRALVPVPGASFELAGRHFAGVVTLLFVPSERPVIARLEARWLILGRRPIEPFLAAGVVSPVPDLGLRAGGGLSLSLAGRWLAFVEVAYERFLVSDDDAWRAGGLLLGLGVGLRL